MLKDLFGVHVYRSWREVPPGLTTRDRWKRGRRQPAKAARPAAYFLPDDFAPAPFGDPLGIPLYHFGQTVPYRPRPETAAAFDFYDYFIRGQNRNKYSFWEARTWKARTTRGDGEGWTTRDQYLSTAMVQEHVRGKRVYGCWGGEWTNWFAIDLDYHGGDPGLFLALLDVLDELAAFFPQVRWCYSLRRDRVTGLHLIGLLPRQRPLEDVRSDLQKNLAFLEDEFFNSFLPFKPSGVRDEDWHPLAGLEIYPAANHNFRLPYAADRVTVTDRWLNLPGEIDYKPNLIDFMDYIKDDTRQAVSFREVAGYLKARLRPRQAEHGRRTSQGGGGRRRSSGQGPGPKQGFKGCFKRRLIDFWSGREVPPDNTIGSFLSPTMRVAYVMGRDKDETLQWMRERLLQLTDASFSDRLSGRCGGVEELFRSHGIAADRIWGGNLYQPDPDQSTEILTRVVERWTRQGFDLFDERTWGQEGVNYGAVDVSDVDFSLTFQEKLAVKDDVMNLLHCDVASAYEAAHRVKAFVQKYPGRELPSALVPHLCQDLAIDWYVNSDMGRCKKAERFLAVLCKHGVIKKLKDRSYFGEGHASNRATLYGLPQDATTSDLAKRWYYKSNTRHVGAGREEPREAGGGSIYITDKTRSIGLDMEALALEHERLNGPWGPHYRGVGIESWSAGGSFLIRGRGTDGDRPFVAGSASGSASQYQGGSRPRRFGDLRASVESTHPCPAAPEKPATVATCDRRPVMSPQCPTWTLHHPYGRPPP